MATQTTHYGFTKPAASEAYNVSVQNGDMDKIDAAIWNTLTFHRALTSSDDLNSLNSEGTGIYSIGNELPVNAPSGYTWAIIIQIKRSDIFLHQYIVKPSSEACLLVREYSGSPQQVWSSWRYASGYPTNVPVNLDSSKVAIRSWGKFTVKRTNGLLIIVCHGLYCLSPIGNETVVATVPSVSNVPVASCAIKVDGQTEAGVAMFASNTLRLINIQNGDKAMYFTLVVPIV